MQTIGVWTARDHAPSFEPLRPCLGDGRGVEGPGDMRFDMIFKSFIGCRRTRLARPVGAPAGEPGHGAEPSQPAHGRQPGIDLCGRLR